MQYSLTVLANTIGHYCEIDESGGGEVVTAIASVVVDGSCSIQESAFDR